MIIMENMDELKKRFMANPKCPKCGGEVIFCDVIDTNAYDNGTYVDTCVGECVSCGATSIWDDTFFFHHRSELQLTKK